MLTPSQWVSKADNVQPDQHTDQKPNMVKLWHRLKNQEILHFHDPDSTQHTDPLLYYINAITNNKHTDIAPQQQADPEFTHNYKFLQYGTVVTAQIQKAKNYCLKDVILDITN